MSSDHDPRFGPRPQATPGTMGAASSSLAFAAVVREVADLGPGLRRLTLGGEDMAFFGPDTDPLDLRLKLVVPAGGATTQSVGRALEHLFPGAVAPEADPGMTWYRDWLKLPESERGAMRTYSARALRTRAGERVLDVDVVLHGIAADGTVHDDAGPAAAFAASARPGDVVHVVGPNRLLTDETYGGIDFRPGDASHLLLVADETAAPAVCSILESLPPHSRGWALIEVPGPGHVQPVQAPVGMEVRWLQRDPDGPEGARLVPEVHRVAPLWAELSSDDRPGGAGAEGSEAAADPVAGPADQQARDEGFDEVDVDAVTLWEAPSGANDGHYAWIAGEAGVVKELRRHLVRDLGIDRENIAFMGYWRAGRASF